jgi:hypothetical protein
MDRSNPTFASILSGIAIRETAMRILTALHRFAETGEGDVKKFQGESGEPPLWVGDYRVRFTEEHPDISASTQSSIAASEVFVCSTHTTAPSYPTSAHRPAMRESLGAPLGSVFLSFSTFARFQRKILH